MPTREHRVGDPPEADDHPGERESALRVSDRERDQVLELLSTHTAEGRLTPEELEARADQALSAPTRGALAVLTADLPASDGRRPERSPRSAKPRPRPDLARRLSMFMVVSLVLVAVWALSGGGYFWPAWPMLGWGMAFARRGRCGHLVHGELARGLGRKGTLSSSPGSQLIRSHPSRTGDGP